MSFLNISRSASPAYGRQYKTNKEMRADWDAGKDFRLDDGPYFSIRDVEAMKAEGTRKLTFVHKGKVAFIITL